MVKLFSLCCLLILSGCNIVEQDTVEEICSHIPYVASCFDYETKIIVMHTTPATNEGTPFYVLIQATDYADFLTDDYPKILEKVAAPVKEPSCLAAFCMIPGLDKTIKIKPSKDKSIAFYVLFTQPKEPWKSIINPVQGFKTVNLHLGEHKITLTEVVYP